MESNGRRKVVKIWSKNVSQNWTKIGQSPWIVPVGTGPGSGFDRVARCAARFAPVSSESGDGAAGARVRSKLSRGLAEAREWGLAT